MSPPTVRQLDVLRAVEQLSEALGYPPSRRELAARLGLRSTARVQAHVDALLRRGLLRREQRTARALALTPEGKAQLVALGTIAGAP